MDTLKYVIKTFYSVLFVNNIIGLQVGIIIFRKPNRNNLHIIQRSILIYYQVGLCNLLAGILRSWKSFAFHPFQKVYGSFILADISAEMNSVEPFPKIRHL